MIQVKRSQLFMLMGILKKERMALAPYQRTGTGLQHLANTTLQKAPMTGLMKFMCLIENFHHLK